MFQECDRVKIKQSGGYGTVVDILNVDGSILYEVESEDEEYDKDGNINYPLLFFTESELEKA